MQVKIDTREKFAVVTPIPPDLTANIAAELQEIASDHLTKPVKNLVLNLSNLTQ
ncbi:MAG: anti-anti-sigma factor, partial [Chitinophagaceae bacterium]|nr:anti-anti-sigma factor [Chitinophagaceae bacterium]